MIRSLLLVHKLLSGFAARQFGLQEHFLRGVISFPGLMLYTYSASCCQTSRMVPRLWLRLRLSTSIPRRADRPTSWKNFSRKASCEIRKAHPEDTSLLPTSLRIWFHSTFGFLWVCRSHPRQPRSQGFTGHPSNQTTITLPELHFFPPALTIIVQLILRESF